ncbi:MAG: EAL domain-containing protein [Actinomycetota bacterium]|nr:EAL domain-containing protein [Actinomycetota bacterium]
MVTATSAALVGCDASELVVAWSDGARRLFGLSASEVLGQPWPILVSETSSPVVDEVRAAVLAGRPSGRLEICGVHQDGSAISVSIEGGPVFSDDRVAGTMLLFRDVAGRLRVQQVAEVGTFVVDLDDDGGLASLETSADVGPMLGMDREEILPAARNGTLLELVPEEDLPDITAERRRVTDGATSYQTEHRYFRADDGELRWLRISADVYRRPDGRPWRALGAIHDVTAERRIEEELAYEASHDALTRLPLGVLLLRRVAALLDDGEGVTLLSVDVDHFGVINEEYGTTAADDLLVTVAARLRIAFTTAVEQITGPTRTEPTAAPVSVENTPLSNPDASPVARTAGDSFLVACPGPMDPTTVDHLAARVQSLFEEPFHLDGRPLWLTACVGSASSADLDAATLAARAERALHQAKRRGPAWSLAFERLPIRDSRAVPAQIGALRQALKDRHLALAYQPLVDLTTGRITGVEALARWPERSTIGDWPDELSGPMVADPSEFVAMAEEAGLAIALGDEVLDMAVRQLADWQRAFGGLSPEFKVAVNVSARQLVGDRLVRSVTHAVEENGISPTSLVLEITETALMEDIDLAAGTISDLSHLGVGVAIDDFGTGYSSLAYLETLPVDVLKLDSAFVARLDGRRDRAIVKAVVGLAEALGFRVVAEGVETAEQVAVLTELGCRYGQGYLLCRPSAPSVIDRLLESDTDLRTI